MLVLRSLRVDPSKISRKSIDKTQKSIVSLSYQRKYIFSMRCEIKKDRGVRIIYVRTGVDRYDSCLIDRASQQAVE